VHQIQLRAKKGGIELERKPSKHKKFHHHLRHLHGKYKRYAAAIAGAAIMTGAACPGIPAAKVLAAETPSTETSISVKNITDVDKNKNGPPGRGWHEHKDSWPSADENQAWVDADGHIYYRSDNIRRAKNIHYLQNPINFVKENAETYGFDPYLDSFRLLTLSNNKALVEVTKNYTGRLFNVLLERSGEHEWNIVETRAL